MLPWKCSCFNTKFVSRQLVFYNTLKESAMAKVDGCKSNIRKIFMTAERMVGSKSSTEIIIGLLKKTTFTTTEIITQTTGGCKMFGQNKYRIIQRMDDSHSFCDRYPTSKDRWLQLGW